MAMSHYYSSQQTQEGEGLPQKVHELIDEIYVECFKKKGGSGNIVISIERDNSVGGMSTNVEIPRDQLL